ncbi:hypothetical protein D918_09146 [Trichuris suis]|nr:hypothetical protein D918_09146 [Trichuris suis]
MPNRVIDFQPVGIQCCRNGCSLAFHLLAAIHVVRRYHIRRFRKYASVWDNVFENPYAPSIPPNPTLPDKNEAIQHCEQVMCEEHYLEMTEICNGNREECPETWNSYMACMKPCINRELESESDEHRLYSSIIRRIEYSMDVETVQKL